MLTSQGCPRDQGCLHQELPRAHPRSTGMLGFLGSCMVGDSFILLKNGSRKNLSSAATLAAKQLWCQRVGSLLTCAL